MTLCTLTDSAKQQIDTLCKEHECYAVTLNVKGGGCAGFEYEWGIYAPNVDYTWYTSENTDIQSLQSSYPNIKMVADPDCTCWFIHKDIINAFKDRKIDMTDQKMGWGIDLALCALSFISGRPVIRDYGHTVNHPSGTNYNKEQASREMNILWNRLDKDMRIAISHIKGDREQLSNYFK